MNIQRSSFYAWKKKLAHPSTRMKSLLSNILLFKEYHAKFPSHGYRWLNAKIRLDTGLVLSDAYAHKCCKITGIKSQAKHYKYKKPGDLYRVFPNLLMTEIQIAQSVTPKHIREIAAKLSIPEEKETFKRLQLSV